MMTNLVDLFRMNFLTMQATPLYGGIVAKNLQISDNRNGELTLYGDFIVTLKVLDLTTNGAPGLNRLMTFTQQVISSKLKGGAYRSGINFLKYNPAERAFDKSKTWTYSIRYNFNFAVNVLQIKMLGELRGNDFVLAVIDSIGHQFTDRYGRRHSSVGLTQGTAGPAVVSYNDWQKDNYIGVHEFFHTLGLRDIEDYDKKDRLMYHLGDNIGQSVSDTEKGDMMQFIMKNINDMTKGTYSNLSYNTLTKLRTFLNDSTNGFKYNKARFR